MAEKVFEIKIKSIKVVENGEIEPDDGKRGQTKKIPQARRTPEWFEHV